MDDRRKQLRFRAWRRGFRELDLILGAFADLRLAEMTESELDAFAALLDAPDHDVYGWIVGQSPAPEIHRTPLLEQIRASGSQPNHG